MPVEIFTRQQFEDALPKDKLTGQPLWRSLGLINGEYCYTLPISKSSECFVRSSVKRDGESAGAGQDSIRLWLAEAGTHKPLAKKLSRWIARTGNWRVRLVDQLRTLYGIGRSITVCNCGKTTVVREVRKDSCNRGRLFVTCPSGCPESFKWIEKEAA